MPNFTEKVRNRHCSKCFHVLYCYFFLLFALHESGTRKAFLLGPWLNNTEIYLIPLLVQFKPPSDKLLCLEQVKLTKISYIGTLVKVWFIQDSGLFRVWFIQDSGLFRVLVYTGFWFIQGLVYTRFWFIQGLV